MEDYEGAAYRDYNKTPKDVGEINLNLVRSILLVAVAMAIITAFGITVTNGW